jgi:hypothetical protein
MAQTFPTYSFSINQGATFSKLFVYQNPDGVTPIDLTGKSVRMHMREEIKSATISLALSSAPSDGIVITPQLGQIRLNFTAAQTAALAAKEYVYDVELYHDDGFGNEIVTRLVEGKITVRAEVTRAEGL